MKIDLREAINPKGIYTVAQAVKAIGISPATFYRYLKQEKIPSYLRTIDKKRVFIGKDLIDAFQDTERILPKMFFTITRRGRPPKNQAI